VAVVVFDASVLIAFLSHGDEHHADAVEVVRASLERGNERWVCAVTLSEILVGPHRVGRPEVVEGFVERCAMQIRPVDAALAGQGAAIRARTGLALPDAYVVGTGLQAGAFTEARLESFDRRLLRVYAEMRAV
jgi:predicted nucleic acid-binding protein